VSARQLLASCAGAGIVAGIVFVGMTRVVPIALAFGLFAAYLPLALVKLRARQRRAELRQLWPDAVDNLASAVGPGCRCRRRWPSSVTAGRSRCAGPSSTSARTHLTVVMTALAVARQLQDTTGLSIKKMVRTLRPLHQVTVNIAGHEHTADPLTDTAREILTATGTEWPTH